MKRSSYIPGDALLMMFFGGTGAAQTTRIRLRHSTSRRPQAAHINGRPEPGPTYPLRVSKMPRIQRVLSNAFSTIGRSYRTWPMNRFLPPVLLDLNQSLKDDREIVPAPAANPPRLERP
jgi:hypothetical protein